MSRKRSKSLHISKGSSGQPFTQQERPDHIIREDYCYGRYNS